MSNYITAVWIILTTILSVPEILISGQQVPCLFLFGDERFDNGNNNGLPTTTKANYPPYGIDYPGAVSTGRFTNGYNVADFLAKLLGFNASIPPYETSRRSGSNVLRGLNYASGGYGILDISGTLLGYGFSMDEQLINHDRTTERISGLLRNQTATKEYLGQCLYAVNIGSNDYINNYYRQPISSLDSLTYSPERFAGFLTLRISYHLTDLYSLGARKVAVFGVGLIGCIPQELALYPPTNGSPCVDDINRAVGLFNDKLFSLIKTLNTDLPDARFTYINATNIELGDPSLVGLKVLNASCCEVQQILGAGQCVRNGAVCSNRNEYAFFDNINPTQIVHNVTASRSYNALSPADAFPVDIRTLVNLHL